MKTRVIVDLEVEVGVNDETTEAVRYALQERTERLSRQVTYKTTISGYPVVAGKVTVQIEDEMDLPPVWERTVKGVAHKILDLFCFPVVVLDTIKLHRRQDVHGK